MARIALRSLSGMAWLALVLIVGACASSEPAGTAPENDATIRADVSVTPPTGVGDASVIQLTDAGADGADAAELDVREALDEARSRPDWMPTDRTYSRDVAESSVSGDRSKSP